MSGTRDRDGHRDRDDREDAVSGTDDRDDHERADDREPDDEHLQRPGTPAPPGTALSELGHRQSGPRPPRRTGVFLDPEDLREHVSGLLRSTLGGHEVDAFGNITFTHDDARVFVTVAGSPVGPQVGVFSVTNLEVPYSAELGRFLLTTNHTLGFGAFSYEPQHEAVWLRHTLLGGTLDLPELQTAVVAVAATAARLDGEIRDRFGGRTFQEAPSDLQQQVEPPETETTRSRPGSRGYL